VLAPFCLQRGLQKYILYGLQNHQTIIKVAVITK